MKDIEPNLITSGNTLASGDHVFTVTVLFLVQVSKGHTVNGSIARRLVKTVKIIGAVIGNVAF